LLTVNLLNSLIVNSLQPINK